MIKRLPILFILALTATGPCFGDAGKMKLEDMIRRSKFVVLGKISRVEFVDGVKLAEIEVHRTLKGDPNVLRLYYWATPSWVCDLSDAEVFEEGIYFLSYPDISTPSKEYLRFLNRAHNFTQGATLHLLEHSGRGRLRPKYIDGRGYLYLHKFSDVIFPRSIKVVQYPDPQDPDLGLVRLEDVLSFITNRVTGKRGNRNAFPTTSLAFPFTMQLGLSKV